MFATQELPLTESWHQEIEILESHIKQKSTAGRPLQILEAGCGQKWDLKLQGTPYSLTGLDLDQAALEIRKNVLNDMDEIIFGDLREAEFGENAFDVIFCSYVLEHVEGAEAVLQRFVRWLRPSGIVIIQIPDPQSVYGFVTRITPHWVHILYYRYVVGRKNAGKPGYGPYPTRYDAVVSRKGIRRFCRDNRLTIKAEFGDGYLQHGRGIVRSLIKAFKNVTSILCLGVLSARHVNLTFVLQREAIAE